MINKYYLTTILVNDQGQDAPSISVYDTKEGALVAYHNLLAAYHNAPDVYWACVMIINSYGNVEDKEIVNHIPEPEPEPEENFEGGLTNE